MILHMKYTCKMSVSKSYKDISILLHMLVFCLLTFIGNKRVSSYRVGYWLTSSKLKYFQFEDFVRTRRTRELEYVKIDLSSDLDAQGPYDVIIHDVHDLITQEEHSVALRQIQALKEYSERNPDVVFLDPLKNVYKLEQRINIFNLVKNCTSSLGDAFAIPPFVELKTIDATVNRKLIKQHAIQYPFVCKPSVSLGTSYCHQMQVIMNEAGLTDVRAPCVAQTFIDHNAVLYKISVIDDHFFIKERPSLKNVTFTQSTTIYFHSHSVSKPNSTSHLNQMPSHGHKTSGLDMDKVRTLVSSLHQQLGLTIFGFDIIIEKHTGKYFVIDINPFPSYEGVSDFNFLVAELVEKTLSTRKSTET